MIKKALSHLFFKDKKKEATGILDSLSNLVDKSITTDEERKEAQVKIERLYSLNESTFVAGGRSALLWGVAIVFIYQAAVRDILVVLLELKHVPDPMMDISDMLTMIIKLLAGTV